MTVQVLVEEAIQRQERLGLVVHVVLVIIVVVVKQEDVIMVLQTVKLLIGKVHLIKKFLSHY